MRGHQLQALHTAYLIVQDRDLAEDIVQNAFLRASQKIEQFDPGRPFGPWFMRIVANASIKAAQRQKRFVSMNGDDEAERLALIQHLAGPDSNPEEFVESEETRQTVLKALGQLTPKQRGVIVMRYYLDMTADEMTEELDSSASAIKWSLHAARKRLGGLLQPLRMLTSKTVIESQHNQAEDQE